MTNLVLEEERHMHSQSLFEIFSHYKTFFDGTKRLCRQAIVFMLYLQGISFFASGYEVELMKGGFSKETLTTIRNIVMVPVLISTFLFSTKLKGVENRSEINRKFLMLRLAAQLFGYFFNPEHTMTVATFLLLLDILMIGNYILDCNIINSFPASALSGMFITMLNSSRNFGTNHTVQLWLIGQIGFTWAAVFGFTYTAVVITQWRRISRCIENGKLEEGQ